MNVPRQNLAKSKTFRWVVCPLLLALSLSWLLLTFRWISLPFLVIVLVLWLTLPWHGRLRRLIIAWGLFIATTFLPADITFLDAPGPPHFVRLEHGKGSQEMGDEEAMGQVLLGGCLTTGLEPKWLFVWRNRPGVIPYDDISEHRLRRIGLALTQYTQDWYETLPPLGSLSATRQALLPYTHSSNATMVTQPQTGELYQPNAALSGLPFTKLSAPDKAPIIYKAHPAPDWTRHFLTLDGKVHSIPESQWLQWEQMR